MSVRETIVSAISDTWNDFVEDAVMPAWTDDVVLLESGMDSLAFAVVVTELEDRLGIDPFSAAEEAFYPETFGQFVQFYEEQLAKK